MTQTISEEYRYTRLIVGGFVAIAFIAFTSVGGCVYHTNKLFVEGGYCHGFNKATNSFNTSTLGVVRGEQK